MPQKARPLWRKKQIRGSRSNATNDPATDLRGRLPPGHSAASVYGFDHRVVLADIVHALEGTTRIRAEICNQQGGRSVAASVCYLSAFAGAITKIMTKVGHNNIEQHRWLVLRVG